MSQQFSNYFSIQDDDEEEIFTDDDIVLLCLTYMSYIYYKEVEGFFNDSSLIDDLDLEYQLVLHHQVCIFLNSTDTILAIIEKFELKNQSKVFCSQDSVDKLNKLGYTNAFADLQFDNSKHVKLAQYTFFGVLQVE